MPDPHHVQGSISILYKSLLYFGFECGFKTRERADHTSTTERLLYNRVLIRFLHSFFLCIVSRGGIISRYFLTLRCRKKDRLMPATPFPDLLSPNVSNQAQNGNQGSILAHSLFGRFLVTGLIGALLITFFPIPAIMTWNPISPILRGGKSALLFPFGWQIVFERGWSKGK